MKLNVKNLLCEAFGTFALVFLGAGAAMFAFVGTAQLLVSLVFGIVVVGLVAVGGGQYNPAVSLAFAIRKRITWVEFALNVVSQLVGGILAGLALWLAAGSNANLGANGFANIASVHGTDVGPWIAILIEAVITFFFVFVILKITKKDEDKKIAPFVIGLSLFALIAFAFNLTGGSLNPARSFGPALIQGGDALKVSWVYFVGPLVGGALAGVADLIAKEKVEATEEETPKAE